MISLWLTRILMAVALACSMLLLASCDHDNNKVREPQSCESYDEMLRNTTRTLDNTTNALERSNDDLAWCLKQLQEQL